MPEIDEGLIPVKKERHKLTGRYRVWECDQCGINTPCRLILTLDKSERDENVYPRHCILDDSNDPVWELVRVTERKEAEI